MKQPKTAGDVLDLIYKTRRDNLRTLAGRGDDRADVAFRLGYSLQYMSQLIGVSPKRTINEKAARTIEAKLGLANGWLDVAR